GRPVADRKRRGGRLDDRAAVHADAAGRRMGRACRRPGGPGAGAQRPPAPPLALSGLAVGGGLTPLAVYAIVLARGTVNAVDYPARQAFVMEMVGSDRVVNAVSINSVLIHSARIVGPALAGVLIATVGVAPCFALNAASFAVMIVALVGMDRSALQPAEIAPPQPGAVRPGGRDVRDNPPL